MPRRSPIRQTASWLLIAGIVATTAVPAVRAASPTAPKPAPAPPTIAGKPARSAGEPAPKSATVARRSTKPALPDTVLADVSGRRVTFSAFRYGWAQASAPARPDSLTPQRAREFLDLLVEKELLTARALEERWTWTQTESIQFAGLRDRTVMRLAMDSAMAGLARVRLARGDSALAPAALGIAVRESTVARLAPTYDETLLGRLASRFAALPRPSADSSLWSRIRDMGRNPVVDPADSARAVAWSGAGIYRVSDLILSWSRLNPLFRPHIETADQVRDLVKNGLFERVLRRDAALRHLERDPRVVDVLRRQSEFNDVQHFVERDVNRRIATDSVTLRRYYDRTRETWALPTTIRVVRMVLTTRADAANMAVRLRQPAEAETLVQRGRRQGVDYVGEIDAKSDSALFATALKSGTGTVLGPDPVGDGWQVARVNEIVPGRDRTFGEALELLARQWANEEGERLMQQLLADLRKRATVAINETALARLVREGAQAPN